MSAATNPPCLQALVQKFGGYDKITAAASAEYDSAIAKWRAARPSAMGLSPLTPADMKNLRRAKRAAAKRRVRARA